MNPRRWPSLVSGAATISSQQMIIIATNQDWNTPEPFQYQSENAFLYTSDLSNIFHYQLKQLMIEITGR